MRPAPRAKVRRARLVVSRVDTWSVLKLAFLLSVSLGIVVVVAAVLIWILMDITGLFNGINELAAMLAGLPPTPIGAVGQPELGAALNPTPGNWLYFVTVNLETGETLFASTNEEQKTNTKKLNDYCKKNQEICNGEKKSG